MKKGIEYLSKDTSGLFESLPLKKVFPNLSTTDTISIGRLGQRVKIPPFWSVFKTEVPSSMTREDLLARLSRLKPLIKYCHPNYGLEFHGIPNDSLIGDQWSLVPGPFPNGHINVESAWDIEVGKPFIKVGVFDSGIDTSHPDLKVLGGKGYYALVDAGYQFDSDPNFQALWGQDDDGHGTAVAGIIGAKRNNNLGVAGIAGGDGSDTSGISLIDFKLSQWGTGYNTNTNLVECVAVGMIDGARSVGSYWNWSDDSGGPFEDSPKFEFSQGFGLHVANHSYSFISTTTKIEDSTKIPVVPGGNGEPIEITDFCFLCKEAYIFSNANSVVNVASRGNFTGSDPQASVGHPNQFPQKFSDHMLISVGGHAYNGERVDGWNNSSTDGNYKSMMGGNIDLLAPGSDTLIVTTGAQQAFSENYVKFNGTSAAAPHVTGAVALLLSYYNKNCYSNYNLDVEDVEYLIQISADDVHDIGYDTLSGWGKLNVTALLDSVKRPDYQIIHPVEPPINRWVDPVDTIHAKGNHLQSNGPFYDQGLVDIDPQGDYVMERYKVYETYDFSSYLGGNIELLDAWPRKNQSTAAQFVNDTIVFSSGMGFGVIWDKLELDREAILESLSTGTITISGWVYNLVLEIDPQFGNIPIPGGNAWYPADTVDYNFEYSIYLRDTVNGLFQDFPCDDSTNSIYDYQASINDLENNSFLVYPNPSDSRFTIESRSSGIKSILVTDISGKLVKSLSLPQGERTTELDLSFCESGMYILNIASWDNEVVMKKVVLK